MVSATGTCPPDDIGGVAGYYHALEVLKTPDHLDYGYYEVFLGDDFDPDKVDLKLLQTAVAALAGLVNQGLETGNG